jgi:long-chain acyl-CoA synthetase
LHDNFLWQKTELGYTALTYAHVLEEINAFSAFLIERGVEKGDRIAMLMENSPEYLISDQGLMQIGCVNVSIYPTLPTQDIEYIIKDSGSKAVIVSNPFLLKKTLKAIENNADIMMVVLTFRQEHTTTDNRIVSWQDIVAQKEVNYAKHRDRIEQSFQDIQFDDLASLIYTSGTTGVPKGVMLSHGNFLSNMAMCHKAIPELTKNDRYLSFLPLCHVYERLATYYLGMSAGAEIAFAKSIDTIAANLQEINPTVMTTVPRLLERMKEKILKNADSQSKTKRNIFYWALGIGEKMRLCKESGKKPGLFLRLQYNIASALVFKKVKAKLGGRMHMIISGGAALAEHVGSFYGNLGINAMEGYGLTETSPVIAINFYGKQIFGTVGRIVPGIEVGIYNQEQDSLVCIQTFDSYDPEFSCEEGEIIMRGPSVMQGYWNKPEETAAVIDANGWFHTGDIGCFYKGHLKITDRIKNMLVNALGKNIYPAPVESIYLQSNKIDQLFLIGDKKEYITAIVVPAKDVLQESFGLEESFFEAEHPFITEQEIYDWLLHDIKKLSVSLAKYEVIKDFLIKRQPFSIDANEITPTLKLKRKVIETRYGNDIEVLYQRN